MILRYLLQLQVIFCFINGVPEEMKDFLQKIGVTVKGKIFPLEHLISFCSSDSDDEVNNHLTMFNNVSSSPEEQE